MYIEVLAVIDEAAGLVDFVSPIGGAQGTWHSGRPPEPGHCHVELEAEAEPRSWKPSTARSPAIERTGAGTCQVRIAGTVVRVDDDAMMSLQVGSDIILVELPGGSPAPHPGESVEFTLPGIGIYPYTL
ncbi:hypothetical protein ACFQ6V_05350 [Streptomyces roseifaciens]